MSQRHVRISGFSHNLFLRRFSTRKKSRNSNNNRTMPLYKGKRYFYHRPELEKEPSGCLSSTKACRLFMQCTWNGAEKSTKTWKWIAANPWMSSKRCCSHYRGFPQRDRKSCWKVPFWRCGAKYRIHFTSSVSVLRAMKDAFMLDILAAGIIPKSLQRSSYIYHKKTTGV